VLYSTQEIRNYLKLFSEAQWNRVCKSTLLIGILRLQELMQRCGEQSLANLSIDAIDELVVAATKKAAKRKRKIQQQEPTKPVNLRFEEIMRYQNLDNPPQTDRTSSA
jgi:hypothetical protein